MANISHIQVNGEVLDIKDASGGGISGSLTRDTIRFTGDLVLLYVKTEGYDAAFLVIYSDETAGVIGEASSSFEYGYEDGAYYFTTSGRTTQNYLLVGGTITDD